jgi:hypothetical protein
LNQAWLHSAPKFLSIYLHDLVHVPGKIHDDRLPYALACQSGPTPTRENGNAVATGDLDYSLDISLVARENDADRFNLVDRSVGGVEKAGVPIETDLSVDPFFKLRGNLPVVLLPA